MNKIITKIKSSFKFFLLFFILTPILFLTSSVSAVSSDAIAVRIMPNPNHYDVEQWYADQGFSGSPQLILVDGYKGIRDGRTVYVNAANVNISNNQLYTNIYLISYNQESETTTTDILGKLISHWKFNRNLTVSGTCSISITNCFVDSECEDGYFCSTTGLSRNKCILQEDIGCLTDNDCPGSIFCDSQKAKVVRDVHRLERILNIKNALEEYNRANGKYPTLSSGTYLPHTSISVWPSWEDTFSNQLGITSYITDPVNRMGACDNFEQDTCWDEETKTFFDSNITDGITLPAGSNVIMYTTNEFGSNYDLCAGMESGFDTQELSIQNLFCDTEEGVRGSTENTPPRITDHMLFGYENQEFNGYIKAEDDDGDPITFTLITSNANWSSWLGSPILKETGNPNQKKIFGAKSGSEGKYSITVVLQDGFNSPVTTNLEIELIKPIIIIPPTNDDPVDTCGDGVVQVGEQCDTYDFDGETCFSYSTFLKRYIGGNLKCNSECFVDISDCIPCSDKEICGDGLDNDCNNQVDDGCTPPPSCGDGYIQSGEQCDGSNLLGNSCISLSEEYGNPRFIGGELTCSSCSFNFNGCLTCIENEICGNGLDDDCNNKIDDNCGDCGNGLIQEGEQCDGVELNDQTCLTQSGVGDNDEFFGGILGCNSECSFDVSNCKVCESEEVCNNGYDDDCNGQVDDGCPDCGDGVIQTGEECDGTELGGETCLSQSGVDSNSYFSGGVLGCNTACSFDTSNCHPCDLTETCGDGLDNDCKGGIDDGCPVCNDGEIHSEEECEEDNLRGQSCATLVNTSDEQIFSHGTLSCSSCSFDTSDCVTCVNAEVCDDGIDNDCNNEIDDGCFDCGNNDIEDGEDCDGSNLNNETCYSQVDGYGNRIFSYGNLSCTDCSFNTDNCILCQNQEICGNGQDDDCDGTADNGCTSMSLVIQDSGSLADDAFAIYVDGRYEGRTQLGQSSSITITSLAVGQHELLIQFIDSGDSRGRSDNCGTLNVSYSDNVYISSKDCFESQCSFDTTLNKTVVCQNNSGYSPYCTTKTLLSQLCVIDSSLYYCSFFDGPATSPPCIHDGTCEYDTSGCTLTEIGSVQVLNITVSDSAILPGGGGSGDPTITDDYPIITSPPFSSSFCSDGSMCTTAISNVMDINVPVLAEIYTDDIPGYAGEVNCNEDGWVSSCFVEDGDMLQARILSRVGMDTSVVYEIGSLVINYTLRY